MYVHVYLYVYIIYSTLRVDDARNIVDYQLVIKSSAQPEERMSYIIKADKIWER
jgi:hypothetical protein